MADKVIMNNNKTTTTTTTTTTPPPAAVRMTPMVCLWALFNACLFAAAGIATLIIANRTPCTKSTWLYRCLRLTDAAAAELTFLLYGELLYSAVAALAAAAPLHMLLTTTRTSTTSRWAAAAVDALAWVALAATAGKHCMELASVSVSMMCSQMRDRLW